MNDMWLASHVPNRLRRIALVGLLIYLVVSTGTGIALADKKSPLAAKPAMSLGAQKLFAQASPAVVKIRTYSKTGRAVGTGSGFLIDADGTVVTNHHVIEDAASARVYIKYRPIAGAPEHLNKAAPEYIPHPVVKIIAVNKEADLAIIKVNGRKLPFLKLRVALPKIGEKVFAIGSPHGLTNTLSDGLVSGLRRLTPGLRRESGMPIIQISAPISHGSSGGPLLSADGMVLGVTTSGIIKGENLGFAVPSERIEHLLKNPYIPQNSTPKLAKPPEPMKPQTYTSMKMILSSTPSGTFSSKKRPRKWGKMALPLFRKWAEQQLVGNRISWKLHWFGIRGGRQYRSSYVPSASSAGGGFSCRVSTSGVMVADFFYREKCDDGRTYYGFVTCTFSMVEAQKLREKKEEDVFVEGVVEKFMIRNSNHYLGNYPRYIGLKKRGYHPSYKSIRLGIGRDNDGFRYLDRAGVDIVVVLKGCKVTTRPKPKPISRPAPRKRTDEDKARSRLALARNYINSRLTAKALNVLKELIAKYPKTRAATAAQAELEKLGKQ